MPPEQSVTRQQSSGYHQQQPQQIQRDNRQGPKHSKPISVEADPEQRTKELLNNIWESLKQKDFVPPELPKGPPILLPNVPAIAAESSEPLDLTASLKKCLRIGEGPSSTADAGAAAVAVPQINQPAPNQLPPPPTNWKIEAQIDHLTKKGAPVPSGPQPGVPTHFMPPNQMHPLRFFSVPPFVQAAPPQLPPPFAPSYGPPVMPQFHSHPPMPMMMPTQDRHQVPINSNRTQHYRQNFNGSHNNNARMQNRISGPQTLHNRPANSSAIGAFVPLQAARKISKMKSVGNAASVSSDKNTSATKAQDNVTSSSTSQAPPKPKQPETQKQPGEKARKQAAEKTTNKPTEEKVKPTDTSGRKKLMPKPGRIAANFSTVN